MGSTVRSTGKMVLQRLVELACFSGLGVTLIQPVALQANERIGTA